MLVLSDIQDQALQLLGEYKFLTISQIVRLMKTSKNHTREKLNALIRLGFIGTVDIGIIPHRGLAEKMYYLTPKGANFLIDELDKNADSIRFPIGEVTVRQDYLHRVETVNVQIVLNEFLGKYNGELITFKTYFDKVGSQRKDGLQTATRLDLSDGTHLNADILTGYYLNQKPYLFTIEVYNGRNTKRIIEQIHKTFNVIYEGVAIKKKFGIEKTCRLLLVFEHETILQATKERVKTLLNEFESPERFVYFKTSQLMQKDFASTWLSLDNRIVDLQRL